MKVKYLFYPLILLFICSCSMLEQRKINFSELQMTKVKMDKGIAKDSCTIVNIVYYFANMQKCDGSNKLANLYICEQQSTGDTIYVFADCAREKGLPFFKGVYLRKSDIKNKMLKETVITISQHVTIPKKAKYVFADLFWLTD